jgi:hypothetical protein
MSTRRNKAIIKTGLVICACLLSASSTASAHLLTVNKGSLQAKAAPKAYISAQQESCSTNDRAGRPDMTEAPKFRVYYAYLEGTPDRSSAAAGWIEAAAKSIESYFRDNSMRRKTLNFDRTTACGGLKIDLVSLMIPQSTQALPGYNLYGYVADHIGTVGQRGNVANALVFVDGVQSDFPAAGLSGVADLIEGQPDPGEQMAQMYLTQGSDLSLIFSARYVAVHEILHSLGAVQAEAPHGGPGNHCWQGHDVMCYDDGTFSSPFAESQCAKQTNIDVLDCGRDDYWNPDPPQTGWLSGVHNVYLSAFLSSCNQNKVCQTLHNDKRAVKTTSKLLVRGSRIYLSANAPMGSNYTVYAAKQKFRGGKWRSESDVSMNLSGVEQYAIKISSGRAGRYRVRAELENNSTGSLVAASSWKYWRR